MLVIIQVFHNCDAKIHLELLCHGIDFITLPDP